MFRDKLQRFMYGRYGVDELGRALLYTGIALLVLSVLTDSAVANGLSLALYAVVVFRMLSRNYAARRKENENYLRHSAPAARRVRLWRNILRDKDHRYFKCPGCGKYLRVPKGKGRITVTCRSCRCSFQKKS